MNYKKLNLTGVSAPHIRTKSDVRHMMAEVLTALLPALGFAAFSFGPRALANTAVSIAGSCGFELLYRLVRKQNVAVGDLSAAVTGVLIAFMCPATAPYWLLLIGDFFAIVVVKQLFGGLGKNYLNPALAARAVLFLWNGEMTAWVRPHTFIPLWGAADAAATPTPLALLRQNDLAGLKELYSLPEMLVGLTSGAVGEVSTLLLLAGGIFLIVRRTVSWRIPAGYLGTAAALFFLFPRGNGPLEWMLCNLMAGGLMLGAFFMAADPVTSPIGRAGQWIYGIGCGLLTVLLRYFGPFDEGGCFAVLLMNLAARSLDHYLYPLRFRAAKGGAGEKKES